MAASPLCQPPDRTLILWTHKGGGTMKRSLGTTLAGVALILTLGACSSTPPVAEMPEFISRAPRKTSTRPALVKLHRSESAPSRLR